MSSRAKTYAEIHSRCSIYAKLQLATYKGHGKSRYSYLLLLKIKDTLIASFLSDTCNGSYSMIMGWLRCSLGFSLLLSSLKCLQSRILIKFWYSRCSCCCCCLPLLWKVTWLQMMLEVPSNIGPRRCIFCTLVPRPLFPVFICGGGKNDLGTRLAISVHIASAHAQLPSQLNFAPSSKCQWGLQLCTMPPGAVNKWVSGWIGGWAGLVRPAHGHVTAH